MHVLKRLFSASRPIARSMNAFPTLAQNVPEVLSLASNSWPLAWPFTKEDFRRLDEAPDLRFYENPRFCYHVDQAAALSLTRYYSEVFRQWHRPSVLDICASHISHFPSDVADFTGRRVALGMNANELSCNPHVDAFVVKDLNVDPVLPFEDNSFDIVTNAVSIDYLAQPVAVCREIARVLKPGGAAVFSLSNRCFPSKAVDIWLRSSDLQHVYIVGAYFHYSAMFHPPSASEISPNQSVSQWRGGSSMNEAYMAVVRAQVMK
jgi:SAM-dependent methyltransferase